ncbi:hypothetical protein D3C76_752200 [compost metagenome]
MLVKGRRTHVGATGQGLDVQRFGVMRMQMTEGCRDPGELPLLLNQCPQYIGLRTAQGDEQQLTQTRLPHDLAFQRIVQATQQPLDTTAHGVIEHCRGHGLRCLRRNMPPRRQAHRQHQLAQHHPVDRDGNTQHRPAGRGKGFTLERHRQRLNQVMPSTIFQGARPQVRQFAALGDDHQARLIDLRPTGHVATGPQNLYARQRSRDETVASGQRLDQRNQGGIGIKVTGQQHRGSSQKRSQKRSRNKGRKHHRRSDCQWVRTEADAGGIGMTPGGIAMAGTGDDAQNAPPHPSALLRGSPCTPPSDTPPSRPPRPSPR